MSQQSEALIKLMIFSGFVIISWIAVEQINNYCERERQFKPIKRPYQIIMGVPMLFYIISVIWMLTAHPTEADSTTVGRALGYFYLVLFLGMFSYLSFKTNLVMGFLSTLINSFIGIFVAIRMFLEFVFEEKKGK